MSDKHEHEFTKLEVMNVIADPIDKVYPGNAKPRPLYKGRADMGFLVKACKCGRKNAIDYGTRKDMRELKEALEKRNENNLS